MLVAKFAAAVLTTVVALGAHAQVWIVSPQPTLAIGEGGAVTPDYQFNQISHLKRLSDGRILVTMRADIRYFDGAGKFVGKAGGRGQGPGEFQYIQDLWVLPGDTLLALSFRNKVWLTADGKYVRQEIIKLDPLMTEGWYSEGATLLPNGNLLAPQYRQESASSPRPPGMFRPVLRYALLDVPSGAVSPLIVAGGIAQMRVGNRSATQPFSPHAQSAIGSDRVYVGDNDTTFISAFTLDGKPAGVFAVADKATPVTTKDLDEYRDRALETWATNPERKAEFEAGWAQIPKPKRFPYWGTAQVDRLGLLWVSSPLTYSNAPLTWRVFDRGGRRVATVTTPLGFTPKDIGADYVLGIARDDDGVETIRMFKLDRKPPGSP